MSNPNEAIQLCPAHQLAEIQQALEDGLKVLLQVCADCAPQAVTGTIFDSLKPPAPNPPKK